MNVIKTHLFDCHGCDNKKIRIRVDDSEHPLYCAKCLKEEQIAIETVTLKEYKDYTMVCMFNGWDYEEALWYHSVLGIDINFSDESDVIKFIDMFLERK